MTHRVKYKTVGDMQKCMHSFFYNLYNLRQNIWAIWKRKYFRYRSICPHLFQKPLTFYSTSTVALILISWQTYQRIRGGLSRDLKVIFSQSPSRGNQLEKISHYFLFSAYWILLFFFRTRVVVRWEIRKTFPKENIAKKKK